MDSERALRGLQVQKRDSRFVPASRVYTKVTNLTNDGEAHWLFGTNFKTITIEIVVKEFINNPEAKNSECSICFCSLGAGLVYIVRGKAPWTIQDGTMFRSRLRAWS